MNKCEGDKLLFFVLAFVENKSPIEIWLFKNALFLEFKAHFITRQDFVRYYDNVKAIYQVADNVIGVKEKTIHFFV